MGSGVARFFFFFFGGGGGGGGGGWGAKGQLPSTLSGFF